MTLNLHKTQLVYVTGLIITLLVLIMCERNQMESADDLSPYLSGAANWSIGQAWRVVPAELDIFKNLGPEEKFNYKFSASGGAVAYGYNAIGLMYIASIARYLFFWQGDLHAVMTLQQCVHLLLSFSVLVLLKSWRQKILFFVFYVANPIIAYYVDFPFYYFWQVIPSVVMILYMLLGKTAGNSIFFISIVFSMIFITRPSTLFMELFVIGYIAQKENLVKGAIAILVFLALGVMMKPNSVNEPWHTTYVGIGGYPNKYNITLHDADGYNAFKKGTGKTINSKTCIENIDLYKQYLAFIKDKYFAILHESPGLLLKNAVLNVLGSYGYGYMPNHMALNYLSVFVGLILALLLLLYREFPLFFLIGISSMSFTLYFPPIGAYMFGSYILVIFAWIRVSDSLYESLATKYGPQ